MGLDILQSILYLWSHYSSWPSNGKDTVMPISWQRIPRHREIILLVLNHSASIIIPKPGRTRTQDQVTCSPELVFVTANDSIFHIRLFFVYTITSIWQVFPHSCSIFVSFCPSKVGFQEPFYSDSHAIRIFLAFHIPLLSMVALGSCLIPRPMSFHNWPLDFHLQMSVFSPLLCFGLFLYTQIAFIDVCPILVREMTYFCSVLLRWIFPLAHT